VSLEPEVRAALVAKERAHYLAAGVVPREAIQDNIVKPSDFLNDPHEVWQLDPWWTCWVRVDIAA
jgi:hypothetical protein